MQCKRDFCFSACCGNLSLDSIYYPTLGLGLKIAVCCHLGASGEDRVTGMSELG